MRHHASYLDDARCDAETILGSRLIVGYSEIGQRSIAAESSVVVEYDVPRESGESRTCIERRPCVKFPRVSVDAVLKRDWHQRDVREHQVNAERRQLADYFGANEATIFSKRGSPRSGSPVG